MNILKISVVLSLLGLSAAQGTSSIESVTCGTNKYTQKQVNEAVDEACRLIATNQQLGTNRYPHRFNNREGLEFATSGPYEEFPILKSGNYTGRKSPFHAISHKARDDPIILFSLLQRVFSTKG